MNVLFKSKFKLGVAKLTKHNGHVHALIHCRNSHVDRTDCRKPGLSGFLYFLYAALELLMAFYVIHTWKYGNVVVTTAIAGWREYNTNEFEENRIFTINQRENDNLMGHI